MKSAEKKSSYFIFFILLGAISGSFIGELLGDNMNALEFLKSTYTIGMSNPMLIDLKVLSITFGINFNINIMSIIGIILSIILYRKY
ncbi:DUF4321 domain-containing protein [Clostridium algoriphilum]|uniref:DUF4321 domain-containing protein n=1 Tax=Clostridium algoriphilum TaxID=198347 RepID=UPI001CF1C0AA|nr:DUF4321 domain-containing protein [Clostridium algoriphilum]MCB2292513.1 DUF4321 domain-containing protein [Clostridium algoriphilum]